MKNRSFSPKSWSLSLKVTLLFVIVMLVSMASLYTAYSGMHEMNDNDNQLYGHNTVAVSLISDISVNFQRQRTYLRDLVLLRDDTGEIETLAAKIRELEASMTRKLSAYDAIYPRGDTFSGLEEFVSYYDGSFFQLKQTVNEYLAVEQWEEAEAALHQGASLAEHYTDQLRARSEWNAEQAGEKVQYNTQVFQRNLSIQVGIIALVIALLMMIVAYITRSVVGPIARITAIASEVGKGNVKVERRGLRTARGDEIGVLTVAVDSVLRDFTAQSSRLSRVADGDLRVECPVRGDGDVLGKSIKNLCDSLNTTVDALGAVSGEVGQGASQVSLASHSLAQGSARQAAAVEQLSESISQIATITRETTRAAAESSALINDMRKQALRSNQRMEELLASSAAINDSVADVVGVLNQINSIAFQTNILALNAAVEAASAGEYGKGFSVVATEVRALAAKTADAAKASTALIQDTMDKSAQGMRLAGKTQEDLSTMVNRLVQVAQMAESAATASQEQLEGIEQVNGGIEQVARVIGLNSESAEHCATAAEEMSNQVDALNRMIAGFKTRSGNGTPAAAPEPLASERARQQQGARLAPSVAVKRSGKKPVILLDNDFGKY